MDSDSIPLKAPGILFHSEPYRKYGNIFWPDFWQEPVPLWDELGFFEDNPWKPHDAPSNDNDDFDMMYDQNPDFTANDEYQDTKYDDGDFDLGIEKRRQKSRVREGEGWPLQAEAGQGLLDRRRYWKVLEWLMFLNMHDIYVYSHALGDKDTFRMAFLLAGYKNNYWQTPHPPALPLVDKKIFGTMKGEVRVRSSSLHKQWSYDLSAIFHSVFYYCCAGRFGQILELGHVAATSRKW